MYLSAAVLTQLTVRRLRVLPEHLLGQRNRLAFLGAWPSAEVMRVEQHAFPHRSLHLDDLEISLGNDSPESFVCEQGHCGHSPCLSPPDFWGRRYRIVRHAGPRRMTSSWKRTRLPVLTPTGKRALPRNCPSALILGEKRGFPRRRALSRNLGSDRHIQMAVVMPHFQHEKRRFSVTSQNG